MKNKNKNKLISLLLVFTTVFLLSCDEEIPGKYKMTAGIPTIYYIRPQNVAYADSLLAGAFMGESIAIIGDNLTCIQEIYFNDIKAILNISFITKNTLLLNVPTTVPQLRSDKLYMVTGSKDTIPYDFIVRIPEPVVNRIKCEQTPEGQEAVLYGDYFFSSVANPIKITIGDYVIPATDIVDVQKNQLTFKAPAMNIKGVVSVTTAYGNSGRTKTIFHDDRGLIMDFEGIGNKGYDWDTPSFVESDPVYALAGNYVRMTGKVTTGAWSNGPADALIYYFGANHGYGNNNLFTSDPKTSVLKFEANVLEAWTGSPMIFFFAPPGSNNAPLWDQAPANGYARAFWIPWQGSGSYTTDGWETVSIPLSEFRYNNSGIDLGFMGGANQQVSNTFNELDIYLTNFGLSTFNGKDAIGTDCNPVILIDNIRVVPNE
jgi:hypothetical protein